MIRRLRSSLHNKVHGVKTNRQIKNASHTVDDSFPDGFETSSESDSESLGAKSREIDEALEGLAVRFTVASAADLLSGTSYFYVCVGNCGEPTYRKKRRGLHISKLLHSRSLKLKSEENTFIIPLRGLFSPEVTVRFSRSALVGQDSFLGECHFIVNSKGLADCCDEDGVGRLLGGSNSSVSCHWRIVANTGDNRPNILPDESIVTDADKLIGLVDSVWKCLETASTADPELEGKRLWLSSLLEVLDPFELNYFLLRIPLGDLFTVLGNPSANLEASLSRDSIEVPVRVRLIKALQSMDYSPQFEAFIASLILGCTDETVFELKRLLNRGGDKHHLLSLMFSYIQSDLVREQIILRFQLVSGSDQLHILSEIDHVVNSPFGSVRLWPDGAIPGSLALFNALSRDVTFSSNKPLSFESWTHKLIRRLGFEDAPLLTGAKSDLYAIKGGVSKLASRLDSSKYSNWSNYRRLYPDGKFVWFGESIEFAKTLIGDQSVRDSGSHLAVGRIVLAIVMGEEGASVGPYTAEPGIVVVSNFVQAAIACFNENLLSEQGVLKSLVATFESELKKIESNSSTYGRHHRQLLRDRLNELKIDLSRFRNLVTEHELRTQSVKEEMVDSIVLTPIEALSPSLTDRSAGTESVENGNDDNPVNGTSQFTLTGL